jgi:hypothetical protein
MRVNCGRGAGQDIKAACTLQEGRVKGSKSR